MLRMFGVLSLAAATLVTSAGCQSTTKSKDSPDAASARPTRPRAAPSSTPSSSSSASASLPLPSSEDQSPPPDWTPPGTHERLAAMRQALLDQAPEKFARALAYPVYVGTASRCQATFADAAAFAPHVEHVVTPAIRKAILEARPPLSANYQGAMLDDGDVWFRSGAGITFNSDAWELPGVACENWKLEPAPAWLSGKWSYSSLQQNQGSIDNEPPTQWRVGKIEIDLAASTAILALRAKERRRCRTLRFGYALQRAETRALGAFDNGFDGELGKDYFLDLDCAPPGVRPQIERIEVLGQSLLVIQADSAFLVFLSRSPGRPSAHTGRADEACGSGSAQCTDRLVCVAQPRKYHPEGVCTPLSQLPWCSSSLDEWPARKKFCGPP